MQILLRQHLQKVQKIDVDAVSTDDEIESDKKSH